MGKVALVLVSHSRSLGQGVAELAGAMAADVHIGVAAGTDDGRLGTSFDMVEAAVQKALVASEGAGVALLTDLGSATLTVDTVLEFADDPDALRFVPGPLVEGAVAGAVTAQQGGDLAAVEASVKHAALQWCEGEGPAQSTVFQGTESAEAVIADVAGLHARPAAMLAQLATQFDARVYVNGTPADSMIEIMGLGARQGDKVTVTAEGAQAHEAMRAVADAITIGFDTDGTN